MFARLGGIVITLVMLFGGAAFAAPPVTETRHQKGMVETFVDVIPTCEEGGAPYRITTTANGVEHITGFDDGRIHLTFTQTGRFRAVPLRDSSLASFTGKFTIWGGFNQNRKTANGTFTFNVHGTGSDGSTFRTHFLDHFNERPDGSVNEFFRCH